MKRLVDALSQQQQQQQEQLKKQQQQQRQQLTLASTTATTSASSGDFLAQPLSTVLSTPSSPTTPTTPTSVTTVSTFPTVSFLTTAPSSTSPLETSSLVTKIGEFFEVLVLFCFSKCGRIFCLVVLLSSQPLLSCGVFSEPSVCRRSPDRVQNRRLYACDIQTARKAVGSALSRERPRWSFVTTSAIGSSGR